MLVAPAAARPRPQAHDEKCTCGAAHSARGKQNTHRTGCRAAARRWPSCHRHLLPSPPPPPPWRGDKPCPSSMISRRQGTLDRLAHQGTFPFCCSLYARLNEIEVRICNRLEDLPRKGLELRVDCAPLRP